MFIIRRNSLKCLWRDSIASSLNLPIRIENMLIIAGPWARTLWIDGGMGYQLYNSTYNLLKSSHNFWSLVVLIWQSLFTTWQRICKFLTILRITILFRSLYWLTHQVPLLWSHHNSSYSTSRGPTTAGHQFWSLCWRKLL